MIAAAILLVPFMVDPQEDRNLLPVDVGGGLPVLRDIVAEPGRITMETAMTVEQHCHRVLRIAAEQETVRPRFAGRLTNFGYPDHFITIGMTSRDVRHAKTMEASSGYYPDPVIRVSGTSRGGNRFTVAAFKSKQPSVRIPWNWMRRR